MTKLTELCLLFEKYKSDKCDAIYHTYSKYYYEILNPLKNDVHNMIEIGIGNKLLMRPIVGDDYQEGASLRAWRDFFTNANIFGLDIDKSVLFNEDRIRCYFTDQSNPKILNKTVDDIKNEWGIEHFDFIIDDGSHIKEHMLCSLFTLDKFLKRDGIYIIEDIHDHEVDFFSTNFPPTMKPLLEYRGNHRKAKVQDNFIVYIKT